MPQRGCFPGVGALSDLATRPAEVVCTANGDGGPERLLITARTVVLGRTTEVARVLPDQQIRMIGAWCFLDHYGPEDVSGGPGMQVYAHPHTGLQTVSWLLDGAIEHRDSLGSQVTVRPGELHVMTAGRGIVHSELSLPDKPPLLHGLQLWVALPDEARDVQPRFDSYPDLPSFTRAGLTVRVLVGGVEGRTAPARTHTPMVGAQLDLAAGTDVELEVDPTFEHGLLVVSGAAQIAGVGAGVDQLVYLAPGPRRVRLVTTEPTRLLLIGGVPFPGEIVMWWNFIGRSHEEVVGYRDDWQQRRTSTADGRFRPVVAPEERAMEAPEMPGVRLKARPRRVAP